MSGVTEEINKHFNITILINLLITIDIILITCSLFLDLPINVDLFIHYFDFFTCLILLAQWFVALYNSESKGKFLKQGGNWVDLIASIPFDAILPLIIPQINVLRYLKLLKLLRIIILFKRFFNNLKVFIEITHMDKIIGVVIFTVMIFTLLLWIWGPTYVLFDDFYFVLVTLTTVGYGDVTLVTFKEKVIAIVLIIVGVFIFSTITGAISSYFVNRLTEGKNQSNEMDELKAELKSIHDENIELKHEIMELKDLIKNK